MRYRLVPPAGMERLRTVRRAVPTDSATVEDCCAHLIGETPVCSRECAREWLVFLRALDLVATDGDGYYRTDTPIDNDAMATRFESSVFGVREVTAVLGDAEDALSVTDVFGRVQEELPQRNNRVASQEGEMYFERLLAWGVVLGLFARTDGRYQRA